MKYEWVKNFVTARTVLGWSTEDFWNATPKMFYAFLFTHAQLQTEAAEEALRPKAVVGKDAIEALAGMARYIR